MAKDNSDAWRKFREREDEAEQEGHAERLKSGKADARQMDAMLSSSDSEQVMRFMQMAEPLIDQVNSLYNMFMVGVERTQPLEKRKQLEQLMNSLMIASKNTQQVQFKFNNLQQRFIAHRDRWDKMIRDLEKGIIKRRTKD